MGCAWGAGNVKRESLEENNNSGEGVKVPEGRGRGAAGPAGAGVQRLCWDTCGTRGGCSLPVPGQHRGVPAPFPAASQAFGCPQEGPSTSLCLLSTAPIPGVGFQCFPREHFHLHFPWGHPVLPGLPPAPLPMASWFRSRLEPQISCFSAGLMPACIVMMLTLGSVKR